MSNEKKYDLATPTHTKIAAVIDVPTARPMETDSIAVRIGDKPCFECFVTLVCISKAIVANIWHL